MSFSGNEMKEEELIYLSRQYTNMLGMPIRIYKNSEEIYSCFTINMTTDPINLCLEEILKEESDIGYYVYDDFLFYGIVNYKEYKFTAGPVSELELSDHTLKRLAYKLEIKSKDISSFASEMKTLSGIHLDTVIQSLILLNFTLNRTMYNISDIRIKSAEQNNIVSEMKKNKLSEVIDPDLDENNNMFVNNARSYLIERDIIKKVSKGDVDGLIAGATKIPAVSSGQLAPHLIRHQKNFFIRLETIVSRTVISAGLDIDEIFAVEKSYISKCESLDNIDRIKNLQYHMIIDYADRVKKFRQYNGHNSKLVVMVEKYINTHISEPIKISDIADNLKRSRGGLTTEFKKHTGYNLSDFIKLKKIQMAEELLFETDKSLVSISNFLGFSSQSHFCRVFKEIKGITPTEYKNNSNN